MTPGARAGARWVPGHVVVALAPVLVALIAGLAVLGPGTGAWAQTVPAPTAATGPATAEAGPGGSGPAPDPAADLPSGRRADGSIIVNGPARTGRPEPPFLQRVVDTLIWAWLVVALVGGTAWWLWTGRGRTGSDTPDPAMAQDPTDPDDPGHRAGPGGGEPGSH